MEGIDGYLEWIKYNEHNGEIIEGIRSIVSLLEKNKAESSVDNSSDEESVMTIWEL